MNPVTYFIMEQEIEQAVRDYEYDQLKMQRCKSPQEVTRLLNFDHEQAWIRSVHSHKLEQAKKDRKNAASRIIKEHFERGPTEKMAYDCWQACRGHLPLDAYKYHTAWQQLKNKPESSAKK